MSRLDEQSARLLKDLARSPQEGARSGLDALRSSWPKDDPALLPPRELLDVADLLVPGAPPVPIRIFTPETLAPRPVLVWLHPGGFVAGSVDDIDGVCRTLAADGRCTVVSVEYRLAPECPFPAALDDVDAALAWVVRHEDLLGIDSGRMAVGGQSAGATLAAAIALRLREERRHSPKLQVLAYPVLDPGLAASSYEENDGRLFTRADLRWYWDCYLGGQRAEISPLAAPLYAEDLEGLPEALILAAGHDPARDDSRHYARRLRSAGVPCELAEYPGTIHAFLSFAGILAVAREALALIAARLRENLAASTPRLQHVGLPYPPDRQPEVRPFYGTLLELEEKHVPAALADRPFIWFEAGPGEAELHLLPEAEPTAVSQRHACLETDRLDAIVERLERAGHQVDRYDAIANRRQAFVHDPFGNLLELTEIRGRLGPPRGGRRTAL